MKKKIFLIFLVAIAIAIGAFFYHKKNGDSANSQPTVTVAKNSITEKAEAIGYIKPEHLITIKSEIGGKVANIFHYEGEFVKKGEPLIEISPTPQPADYASAYEKVKETKAVEKNATNHLDRYKDALNKGLISANYKDYLDAEQNYETAKEQRILAEQHFALLNKGSIEVMGKNIGNVVPSPIDGYILDRNVDTGDPVISLSSAQSATTLFTIANMHDLLFEGSLDEIDSSKIKLGMNAVVKVGALPDEKISGKVTRISLQSEQAGGGTVDSNLPFNVSFKVEITDLKEIPAHMTMRAGYSATADINIKTAKNVLTLPERVIHFDDNQKPYVLLPSNDPKNPTQKSVELGLSDGINVEITKGLDLNEKVLDQPENNNNK